MKSNINNTIKARKTQLSNAPARTKGTKSLGDLINIKSSSQTLRWMALVLVLLGSSHYVKAQAGSSAATAINITNGQNNILNFTTSNPLWIKVTPDSSRITIDCINSNYITNAKVNNVTIYTFPYTGGILQNILTTGITNVPDRGYFLNISGLTPNSSYLFAITKSNIAAQLYFKINNGKALNNYGNIVASSTVSGCGNLVTNGSFENNTACPANQNEVNLATGWGNVSGMMTNPDYYSGLNSTTGNACAGNFSVPANILNSNLAARTGNSYMGIAPFVLSNWWSEYIQTNLGAATVQGKKYFAEMWVKNASYSRYTSNNLGMLFTTSQVSNSTYPQLISGSGNYSINASPAPQINFSSNINATAGWTRLYGTFTASGAFSFLTIGNFYGYTGTTGVLIPGAAATAPNYAYYHIDDVSLIPITGANINICAGNSAQIGGCVIQGATYSWSPALGLSSTSVSQPVASPAATTTYTVVVTLPNGSTISDNVTVTVNPTPTANITQSLIGTQDVLTCNPTPTAGITYLWSTGATTASINPSTSGTYTCTVTNAQGCTNIASYTYVACQAPTVTVNNNFNGMQMGNMSNSTTALTYVYPATPFTFTFTIVNPNTTNTTYNINLNLPDNFVPNNTAGIITNPFTGNACVTTGPLTDLTQPQGAYGPGSFDRTITTTLSLPPGVNTFTMSGVYNFMSTAFSNAVGTCNTASECTLKLTGSCIPTDVNATQCIFVMYGCPSGLLVSSSVCPQNIVLNNNNSTVTVQYNIHLNTPNISHLEGYLLVPNFLGNPIISSQLPSNIFAPISTIAATTTTPSTTYSPNYTAYKVDLDLTTPNYLGNGWPNANYNYPFKVVFQYVNLPAAGTTGFSVLFGTQAGSPPNINLTQVLQNNSTNILPYWCHSANFAYPQSCFPSIPQYTPTFSISNVNCFNADFTYTPLPTNFLATNFGNGAYSVYEYVITDLQSNPVQQNLTGNANPYNCSLPVTNTSRTYNVTLKIHIFLANGNLAVIYTSTPQQVTTLSNPAACFALPNISTTVNGANCSNNVAVTATLTNTSAYPAGLYPTYVWRAFDTNQMPAITNATSFTNGTIQFAPVLVATPYTLYCTVNIMNDNGTAQTGDDFMVATNNSAVSNITIYPPCCNTSYQFISSNTALSGSYSGNYTVGAGVTLTVANNTTFNNATFEMQAGSRIIVNSYKTLTLNNSLLQQCGSMWRGIFLNSDAVLIANPNNLTTNINNIRGAEYGIRTFDATATVVINRVQFLNNRVAVCIDNITNNAAGLQGVFSGDINNNTFNCTTLPTVAANSGIIANPSTLSYVHLWFKNVAGAVIFNSSFNNSFYGVVGQNASLRLQGNTFLNMLNDPNYVNNNNIDYDFQKSANVFQGGIGVFGFGTKKTTHSIVTAANGTANYNNNIVDFGNCDIACAAIQCNFEAINHYFGNNTKKGFYSVDGALNATVLARIKMDVQHIGALFSQQSMNDAISITNNIINVTSPTNQNAGGIDFQALNLPITQNFVIDNNEIHLLNNKATFGIRLNGVKKNTANTIPANVTNNFVEFVTNTSSNASGIKFTNTDYINIGCNNVQHSGGGIAANIDAFSADNTKSNSVQNNCANYTYSGLRFKGTCTSTNLIKSNTMNEHTFGLYIDNNGQIGTQNHSGNIWQSPNYSSAQVTAKNIAFAPLVPQSAFVNNPTQNSGVNYYDPTQLPIAQIAGIPSANAAGWFNQNTFGTGANTACSATVCNIPAGGGGTGGGGNINTGTGNPNSSNTGTSTSSTTYSYIDPNNPTNYSSTDDYFAGQFIAMNLYQQVNNWKADRMAYEKLIVDPSIAQSNPIALAFYALAQNRNFAKFEQAQQYLQQALQYSPAQSSTLESLKLSNEALLIDLETAIANGDNALIASLSQQYEANQLQEQSIKQAFDANADAQAALMQSKNNEAQGYGNSFVENEKLFNDVIARTLAKGEDITDPADWNIIQQIAMQCPYSDGAIVYTARSLYSIIDNTIEYNDDALCGSTARKANTASIDYDVEEELLKKEAGLPNKLEAIPNSLIVYPNPANDAINISGLDLEKSSNVTLQNSLGQIIYMVNVKGGIQKINTGNITNGIYMLKVTNEQGVIGTQKVTILH